MTDAEAMLRLLPEWIRFDFAVASWIVATTAVLLCVWYLWGSIRLWAQHRFWNPARVLSFVLGCAITFAVATLGVNAAASDSLTALFFQQITLMTVVPPLILTGAPGTLLLRSTPHRGIGRMVLRVAHAGLRARWTGALMHPAVAIVVLLVLYPGFYLSGITSMFMASAAGADVLLALILVGGLLAAFPLWSADPLPRPQSYPARLIDILVELQIHAVFGLTLLRIGRPMFSGYSEIHDGVSAVYDQAVAGMLLWTYAEIPLFIVLIVCLTRWFKQDRLNLKLHERQEDAAMDDYNAYLAGLSGIEKSPEADQSRGWRSD